MHLKSLGSGQSGQVVGGPHKSSYDSRFGGNDPKTAIVFESPPLLCGLSLSAKNLFLLIDKSRLFCGHHKKQQRNKYRLWV